MGARKDCEADTGAGNQFIGLWEKSALWASVGLRSASC